MISNDVWVTLADIDKIGVGTFTLEDVRNNSYISPFDDIDLGEYDGVSPDACWQLTAKSGLKSEPRKISEIEIINGKTAVSVVIRNVGSQKKLVDDRVEEWRRRARAP